MTTGPFYECPWCTHIKVEVLSLVSHGDPVMECQGCYSKWYSVADYKDDVAVWKTGRAAGAAAAKPAVSPDYLTSGELQADIENVINHAVEEAVQKAVDEAMNDFCMDLEGVVRHIYKTGTDHQMTAYTLYDTVMGELQQVQRKIAQRQDEA